MTIIALLLKQKETRRTTVFVGPGTDIRTVYVENEALETGQEKEMAMVEFALLGPGAISFVEFLDDHIALDEAGRVTVGQIWDTWAVHCGTDAREKLIAGISRKDAGKLFGARFGASEQTRARIDGRVQRCWTGFRMIPAGT